MVLKRLLAATDLSMPARQAAERAALLATQLELPLELLHIIAQEPLDRLRQLFGGEYPRIAHHMLEAAHAEMQGLAQMLHESYGIDAGVHVVAGAMLSSIQERIDAIGADLLIVGARGESYLRHTLLGSTAERMVNTTRQPILVVKQPPQTDYQHVLVPIDFSPASSRALQWARVIAPGATLMLLHIFDVPFENKLYMAGVDDDVIQRYRIIERQTSLEKLHQLVVAAGIDAESVTLHSERGTPWLNILEQERHQAIDLIVMGKQGAGRIEELLLGSVSKHVLAQSQSDVLISV